MTPIQTPPGMSESAVDMSPEAIMSRLEMIGQLNELCRFLASGTILPREGKIEQLGESAHRYNYDSSQSTDNQANVPAS